MFTIDLTKFEVNGAFVILFYFNKKGPTYTYFQRMLSNMHDILTIMNHLYLLTLFDKVIFVDKKRACSYFLCLLYLASYSIEILKMNT